MRSVPRKHSSRGFSEKNLRFGEDVRVLNILIVEDDSQLAVTLKYLVEDNPRYRVVAMAEDADGAIAATEQYQPDLVLLDLHLAHGSTGFSVAVRLNDLGVDNFKIGGALLGSVAQRLLRQICPECKEQMRAEIDQAA